jgi:hypothetical protein
VVGTEALAAVSALAAAEAVVLKMQEQEVTGKQRELTVEQQEAQQLDMAVYVDILEEQQVQEIELEEEVQRGTEGTAARVVQLEQLEQTHQATVQAAAAEAVIPHQQQAAPAARA